MLSGLFFDGRRGFVLGAAHRTVWLRDVVVDCLPPTARGLALLNTMAKASLTLPTGMISLAAHIKTSPTRTPCLPCRVAIFRKRELLQRPISSTCLPVAAHQAASTRSGSSGSAGRHMRHAMAGALHGPTTSCL